MTQEEIVRALRHTCDGCNPTPCCEFEALGPEAADLIESLTAQLAKEEERRHKQAERLHAERSQKYDCFDVISDLKEQLAASQRREGAAVEDLYRIASCDACKHYDAGENACGKPYTESFKCFEWRGEESE